MTHPLDDTYDEPRERHAGIGVVFAHRFSPSHVPLDAGAEW